MQIMDSIVEGIRALPDPQMQKEAMWQVTNYLWTGEVPDDIDPIIRAMLLSWAPVLDTSRRRSNAGKKGGQTPCEAKTQEDEASFTSKTDTDSNLLQKQKEHNTDFDSEAKTQTSEICLQSKNDTTPVLLNNGREGKGSIKETTPNGVVKKSSRFSPPTKEQVEKYAQEKNLGLDPERFVDFYASKGWKVGTSSMKDWKAAARNWARRSSNPSPSVPKPAEEALYAAYD